MCTSMAVAASLMGGVVQVMKEKKDAFDFRAALTTFFAETLPVPPSTIC